jgi:hypothetical protein
MAEQPSDAPRVNLQEVAQKLRKADHLEPEAQQALADLLDELAKALPPAGPASPEENHLAASAAHLAKTLHQRKGTGALAAAIERFETSVARAEAKAPIASGIAHRIIEALANLGI